MKDRSVKQVLLGEREGEYCQYTLYILSGEGMRENDGGDESTQGTL
jgi:hypothetical protein